MIASEDAIAKGIRRIVALTGTEAEHAVKRADRFDVRIDRLAESVAADKSIVGDKAKHKALLTDLFVFGEVRCIAFTAKD